MARLRGLLATILAGTMGAPDAARAARGRWDGHIAEASQRFAVPAAWIREVIRAESGGRTMLGGRPIRSHAGAMDLMQLMPGTWQAMRRTHGLGRNPDDPRDDILAGTAYLRAMYDRFGYPGLFAAYNAGPGRYGQYLASRRGLPAQTIEYVCRVTRRFQDCRRPGARSAGRGLPVDLSAVPPVPCAPEAIFARGGPGTDSLFFPIEGG